MGINSFFFSKSNLYLKLFIPLFISLSFSKAETTDKLLNNHEDSKFSYLNLSYAQTNFQKSGNSDFIPYSSHGIQLGYGKETFANSWVLISTEINIASQLANKNNQIYSLEITNKIHPQYIQYFFSEIGILSLKENNNYLSGLTIGAGIVFNHKDILEIPQLFNFLRTESFEKKIEKHTYDFFIKANFLLYSNLKADPIVNSNFGFRIYF